MTVGMHIHLALSHGLLSCRGGIAGLATIGSVVVFVCAAAVVVTKTNFVPLLKERWNMQSYEAVESVQSVSSNNTIPLRDIKVDSEAASEAPSSARSRSPSRTQAFE